MDTKVISLREAAERLGITAKAVKYRLKVRGITPAQVEGRYGPTLAISEEQFLVVCQPASTLGEGFWGGEASAVVTLERTPEMTLPLKGTPEETPPQAPVTDTTLAMALELATKTMDALAIERAEREKAQLERDRAERRAEALALELGSYRRALSENAESLAEERANRLMIEAREEERIKSVALELDNYRRELSENAESWAEERAHRLIEAREEERKSEALEVELLKVDTPARANGWSQRVRRWFGLSSKVG